MITAYPLGFTLGPIHVTGFGLMMMCAFGVGGWLIDRECRRNAFANDYAGDIIIGALIGGILGAKLWFAALHGASSLLDRGGLVWYGGFLGGTLGVVAMGWRRRVPMRWTAQLVAPALPAAYAVGRVGCYVVGDDYGIPTTLPWGVRFPQGLPPTTAEYLREFHVPIAPQIPANTLFAVHPTQLYEIVLMLLVFLLLWSWRARARGTGWLFGAYLACAGIERFAVEGLRAKDDRVLPGMLATLSIAQLTSLLVMVAGFITIWVLSPRTVADPGPWLAPPPGASPGRVSAKA